MSADTLTPFDGRDVVASGIEMPGASGGLNKALRVDRLELHHGEKVRVVVEAEVVKVRHDMVKDTEVLERVHVLRVENAAIVDQELVADILAAQAERVEQAGGVHRLPYKDADDDADDSDTEDEDDGDAPDNVTDLAQA